MSTDSPAIVRTMLGAAHVELALSCLGSLKALVRHPLRFAIHEDGTLVDDARARLVDRLGPCEFIDPREAGEKIAERLAQHPRCARFRAEHLFGMKLFDIPMLSSGRVIYCDTDILFTRPLLCPGYFSGNAERFVAMRDLQESYAVRMADWKLLRRHGIRLASRVCAGMMSFEQTTHDLDFIEWMLGFDEQTRFFDGFRFWAEQTIYAALAARAGCGWIEPAEAAIAEQRLATREVLPAILHFAGFYRPYLKPALARVDFADARPPLTLGTRPSPDCTLARRAVSAVRRRFLIDVPPMMKNDSLSTARLLVVTPTLGTSPYLEETVRGILALPIAFQHVLVCPAPMVEPLRVRFPHALVLADAGKEAGLYGAINIALQNATEEWDWFTYINDDDELGPDFGAAAQAHFARAKPEPVVYGRVRIIDDDGRTISFLPLERRLSQIPSLLRAGISPLNQQGMLFHRSIVQELVGFDLRYRICADLDFWARALAAGHSFRHVPKEMGRFRIRRGQISGDVRLTEREQEEIACRLFPHAGSKWRKLLAKLRFRLANIPRYVERIRRVGWRSSGDLLSGGGRVS